MGITVLPYTRSAVMRMSAICSASGRSRRRRRRGRGAGLAQEFPAPPRHQSVGRGDPRLPAGRSGPAAGVSVGGVISGRISVTYATPPRIPSARRNRTASCRSAVARSRPVRRRAGVLAQELSNQLARIADRPDRAECRRRRTEFHRQSRRRYLGRETAGRGRNTVGVGQVGFDIQHRRSVQHITPARCNTTFPWSVAIRSSFTADRPMGLGRKVERVANTPSRRLPPRRGGRTVGCQRPAGMP